MRVGKNLFGSEWLFFPTHLTVAANHSLSERRAVAEIMDIAIYESVLRDDSLPRIPKHVLLYLVFRAGDDDTCYPSQGLIAKQIRYGRQRVAEAISYLKDQKYIVTKPKGRCLVYDLSSIRTRQGYNLSGFKPDLSGGRTRTCPPGGHRTSIELAKRTTAPSARDFEAFLSLEELERRRGLRP
jgi:hypothetical protein